MYRLFVLSVGILSAFGAATGIAETEPTFNRVNFHDSATREVENDLMVAVLFAQSEGRDAVQPADEVNQSMDWALSFAGAQTAVKAQTLGYRSSAIYKDGRIRGWRVRQSLRLESTDGQILGDLAGRLQERLKIESIGYQVSEDHRREAVAELTTRALERFTDRAEAVSQALGRQSYRLVKLNINDDQARPVPMMRAMTAETRMDAMPAPARIEAGTQRITVTVSGEIELSED